jgi:glutamate-1-semialdehyde 2,1-aminomutase
MSAGWSMNLTDKKILSTIWGFIPDSVFDIHAHIYRSKDLNVSLGGIMKQGPSVVSADVWREHTEELFGKSRVKGGLFIPYPHIKCDMEAANNYLAYQLERHTECRGLMLIKPEDDREKVEDFLDNHPYIVGFKPYHVYSNEEPTFDAGIPSYLPEWAWEIAHRRNLIITLHLVKPLALADTNNSDHIVSFCTRYPNAKLILAHAGRGFHRYNTITGLKRLGSLPNLWFDTSAICEPGALKAILAQYGPKRLLWGSDFPISQTRGKCVDVGDGFVWLDTSNFNWNDLSPACNPTLVAIESLRALKEAADDMNLTDTQISDIFCNNALEIIR